MLEESLASRNQSATKRLLLVWKQPALCAFLSVFVDLGILSMKPYFQIGPKIQRMSSPNKQGTQ